MRDAEKTLKINTICLLARCTDPGKLQRHADAAAAGTTARRHNTMTLAKSTTYGGLHFGQRDVAAAAVEVVPTDPPATWRIRITRPGGGNLTEDPVKKVMEVRGPHAGTGL